MTIPFYFSFYNIGTAHGFKIVGDFRSGTLLTVFSPLFKAVVEGNEANLKIDLTEVTFMDSDSMHLIKFAEDRNCWIVWDKKAFPYQRYTEKFQPHPLMDEHL